jgi:hypothetical protein
MVMISSSIMTIDARLFAASYRHPRNTCPVKALMYVAWFWPG